MNVFMVAFRLYLFWFLLIHAAAIVVYISLAFWGGLAMEIFGITMICFLAQPALKKYQAYFHNHGISMWQMYMAMSVIHLILYTSIAFLFETYARN